MTSFPSSDKIALSYSQKALNVLFVCSNENQSIIFLHVAKFLRDQGICVTFLSLDHYYNQHASKHPRQEDFPLYELKSSLCSGNWYELPWSRREPIAFEARRELQALLVDIQPRCIVVGNDIGMLEQLVIRLATESSINTALVQDGLLETAPALNQDGPNPILMGDGGCELLCLWGSHIAKRMRERGIGGRIALTGNPRYDSLCKTQTTRYRPQTRRSHPIVILAGSCYAKYGQRTPQQELAIYDRILQILLSRNDIIVLFKLHPYQDPNLYQSWNTSFRDRVKVISGGDSLDLLQAADLLITIESTVALEAMLLDVPAVMLPYLANVCYPEFVELPTSFKSEELFFQAIHAPNFPENLRLSPSLRPQLLRRTITALDGKATQRVGKALLALCSQKTIPKLSILMAIESSSEIPQSALTSAIGCSELHLELLLVDRGANPSPLTDFVASLGDSRVKAISSPRSSLGEALNVGLAACQGELVMRLSAHARMLPSYDQRFYQASLANPDATLFLSNYYEIDHFGRFHQLNNVLGKELSLMEEDWRILGAFAFRRQEVDGLGGYPKEGTHPDRELVRTFLTQGYQRINIPAPLFAVSPLESPLEAPTFSSQHGLTLEGSLAPSSSLALSQPSLVNPLSTRNAFENSKISTEASLISVVLKKSQPLFEEAATLLHRGGPEAPLNFSVVSLSPSNLTLPPKTSLRDIQVSVIIPSFNRQELLEEAVRHVSEQPGGPYEMIIVNDAGHDFESSFLQMLTNLHLPVSVLKHNENSGLGACRNTGAHFAKGNWLLFLDDDDGLVPNSLRSMVDELQKYDIAFAYADHIRQYFDSANRTVVRQELRQANANVNELLQVENGIGCQSFLIKKEFFTKVGGYRQDMMVHEDYNFNIRAARLGPIAYIQAPLMIYNCRTAARMNVNRRFYWFATSILNHLLYRSLVGETEGLKTMQIENQYQHLSRALAEGNSIVEIAQLVLAWWEVLLRESLSTEISFELPIIRRVCPGLAPFVEEFIEASPQRQRRVIS